MEGFRHSVPYVLLFHAFRNRMYGTTQLYLFIKMQAPRGYATLDKDLIKTYQAQTNKCPKTFNNNISKLISLKWVTINSKRNEIHVKSYSTILSKIGYEEEHITGVIWESIYFKHFSAFIYAAIITKVSRVLKWQNKISETNKGGHTKRGLEPFLTLPYTYLAKAINISKSMAQKMFSQAKKASFIKIENTYELIPITGSEANLFKTYNFKDNHKVRIIKDKVYFQKPNRIYTCIKLKRKRIKKKSIPYIRDIIKGKRAL